MLGVQSVPESDAEGHSSRVSSDSIRALPGGIAIIAISALLWLVGGNIGLAGGVVLLGAWALLPAVYAFAIGQVVLLTVTQPVTSTESNFLLLSLLELGLVGVLVGPSLRSTRGRHTVVWILLGTAALSGVTLASYALWGRIWLATAVLVSVGSLGSYVIHRYELVVLGKVPDPDADSSLEYD